MAGKDDDRPHVRCSDCQSFTSATNYCVTARKVFVIGKATTCMKFARKWAKSEQTRNPREARPGSLTRREPWTVDELRFCLEVEDLAAAVTEIAVDEQGRAAVRFAADVDLDTMNRVGWLLTSAF